MTIKIPHPKFCVLPWISLETSPVGTVRPCCLALEEITDQRGEKYRLGHSDFQSIRDSDYMQQLRQDFLQGKQPGTCQRCWSEEAAGRTSKRMHTLDRLKHMVHNDDWSVQSKPLKFLDLKLGNICNLKCRICGSWSSSTFAAEEIRFQADRKQNYHYEMLRQGAWPRDNTVFWQDLAQHVQELEYIEFTGGEPFMIQEHFDLLQSLVDTGHAAHVEIHYNTNGTIFPMGAEKLWRHFRHVEVAFSIDDVHDRFEYQRSGADWLEVQGHIELFRDMRGRNHNISLQCCSTVNIFNAWYLEELANWIDTQQFDFVYWNMLHEARHFCITSLPEAAKQEVCQRLAAAQVSAGHRAEFDRICDFIWSNTSLPEHEIRQEISRVDTRRNQQLKQHHSELAKVLNYD